VFTIFGYYYKRKLTAGISSALAGYFSTRTYKMFKGQNWKKNTLAVSARLPFMAISRANSIFNE
jgi:hypothetical protein